MDSIKHMNEALQYIEEHLTDEIDMKQAARLAVSSEYHFSRMFSFLAGLTLAEYIRRRRLTLAGFELTNSDSRIMDLAVSMATVLPMPSRALSNNSTASRQQRRGNKVEV